MTARTVWQGDRYIEPIRGEEKTMLLQSDKHSSTYAVVVIRHQCGDCHVFLDSGQGFPARCAHCGVLNYLK